MQIKIYTGDVRELDNTELFMALVDKEVVGDGLTFVLRDGTEQKVGGVR